jgi:hypothetical protein
LATEQLLGGYPEHSAAEGLSSGLSRLGGEHVTLEMGHSRTHMCPQPRYLSRYIAYQALAILWGVDVFYQTLHYKRGFPRTMVCGKAVIGAITAYYQNLGAACPHLPTDLRQDPTPEEVVDYIKKQLQSGKTWNDGIRLYTSMHYRGTLLYACTLKLMGQFALAYEIEEWAHDFIELADEEFRVSEMGDYKEKGSSFMPSFRIGFMVGLLRLHAHMRGDGSPEYNLLDELFMCLDIIAMAKKVKLLPESGTAFAMLQFNVAYYRKPLAYAHSMIGAILNDIRSAFPMSVFKEVAADAGFIPSQNTNDDDFDAFAIIAEHYRIAAENELPDTPDCAVFWWACASNMARAKASSGYTLGSFRRAVESAQDSEKKRDVYLFGDANKAISYSAIAKFVAHHFHEEADSFILPCVKIIRPKEGIATLEVNGEVICSDFDKIEKEELKHIAARRTCDHELLDTKEITEKHGPEPAEIPSLEMLCIRELHKAGYEPARGETDGAVIVCKAMMVSY